MSNFTIGAHLSASKGYLNMAKTAVNIGANTFQFFTRNPRGGQAKPIDLDDITKFQAYSKENGINVILAHAPYTLNFCAADEGLRTYARETLQDDIKRMELVPGNLYNFHPGSHVHQGTDIAIPMIAGTINATLYPEMTTTLLLETMAGKGTEVGRTFEELRAIIDLVKLNEKVGVCLDTCHVSDAGYDIINRLDDILNEFDHVIGMSRLKAIHLNDSKNVPGSHKDRHEKIGLGNIGLDAITRIINHPTLKDLPFFLETPNEVDGYAEEIALLKTLRQ